MKKRYITSIALGALCLFLAMISFDHPSLQQREPASQSVMSDKRAFKDYQDVHSSGERTNYKINAKYDEKHQKVVGKLHVQVPNHEKNSREAMYFHLYPNAFRDWEFNEAAAPTKEGFIDVSNVRINDSAVKPKIDKTIMELDLEKPLPPGKKAEVTMDFALQIPQGAMRLNHVDRTAFLAQWYPMLAAYDEHGWHTDPYTVTGDPFYTHMADFSVSLQVPRGYHVISTAKDHDKPATTVTLSQKNVRDFAIVITKDYDVKRGSVGQTEVNVWYRESMSDVVDELFTAAKKGLAFFNEKFGEYRYSEIDVVLGETGYGIAGMEYPGLVTSLDRLSTRDGEMPAVNVVIHELAHQWWYGMVGNNQVKEPWLDEGLTTFSESLYMDEVAGQPERQFYKQVAANSEKVNQKKGLTVVQPLYSYPEQLYGLMVYARPAAMLWDLSEQIGQEQVIKILRTYFDRYNNKIATTDDFIQTAIETSEEDLRPFFDQWLYFRGDE